MTGPDDGPDVSGWRVLDSVSITPPLVWAVTDHGDAVGSGRSHTYVIVRAKPKRHGYNIIRLTPDPASTEDNPCPPIADEYVGSATTLALAQQIAESDAVAIAAAASLGFEVWLLAQLAERGLIPHPDEGRPE